ncbi:hypothetical protein F511_16086 [Dorcoceras hygrometricum]|uniref:Uncharacterized protein n=1 Tax=Dorcoceras hygrometricum TaxID=472368 RepID=A0A2Z7BUV2_9LAMI|nr:hypothetical protein F511_16086 [Dorcoceras hygrometricum]
MNGLTMSQPEAKGEKGIEPQTIPNPSSILSTPLLHQRSWSKIEEKQFRAHVTAYSVALQYTKSRTTYDFSKQFRAHRTAYSVVLQCTKSRTAYDVATTQDIVEHLRAWRASQYATNSLSQQISA